jgi:N-acetylneuraminic acid mutarotase
MTRPSSAGIALTLSVLVSASCRENTAPTQPDTGGALPWTVPALAVTSNSWITRANLPSTERFGLASAVVANAAGQSILYAIGGNAISGGSLSKVQAYNAATNTWTFKASLPKPLYESNGTGVIGGKVYISGGIVSYKAYATTLYMYDPATNIWTRKRDMPNSGFGGVTGVISDRLYVLTGCDQEDCYPSQADAFFYRYDPAANQWTVFPTPPSLHSGGVGAAIGGKFYVAGNAYGGRQLDVYDPATNRWTTKASAPVDREAPEWHSAASSTC